jgi:addiction module HigA family antidote
MATSRKSGTKVTESRVKELKVAARPNRAPSHPGLLIREILQEHLGVNISEAARQMHVSRQSLHAVLRGAASLTPEMALRLGRLFGADPALWLNMQMAHDLWKIERALRAELARIPAPKAAA